MPYCTQCGKQVAETDQFCASCGGRQKGASAPPQGKEFLSSIQPRTAALLCYVPVVGWIAAVVVLAAHRFREDRMVRFHAFQGLYLFVAWLILDWGISPFFLFHNPRLLNVGVTGLLKGIIFVAWIVMIVKTSKNEDYHLPLFGDLAERSLTEQR